MSVLFATSVVSALLALTSGQMPDVGQTATALDLITDSMKSVFKLDGVMKTFRKISEGMIPFPLFVPIVPKNKVMELLKGKKSSAKGSQMSMDSLEQISGEWPPNYIHWYDLVYLPMTSLLILDLSKRLFN